MTDAELADAFERGTAWVGSAEDGFEGATKQIIAALRQPSSDKRIKPTHTAADAFWKYWKENGETHKHGYYESTWEAINAALAAAEAEGRSE